MALAEAVALAVGVAVAVTVAREVAVVVAVSVARAVARAVAVAVIPHIALFPDRSESRAGIKKLKSNLNHKKVFIFCFPLVQSELGSAAFSTAY